MNKKCVVADITVKYTLFTNVFYYIKDKLYLVINIFRVGRDTMRRLYLPGMITGFLNGLLGAGGGLVLLLFLKRSGKLPAHKAHATALAVMLPLSVLSACIYMGSAEVSLGMAMWLALGGMAGGYTGARFLKRVKPAHLGKILGVLLIFSSLRMVFG